MKQMAMNGDSPFLPQEIIIKILIRLPVKSLIRFQSVCKHWRNLIKTPSFIEEHRHHSSNQNPSLLLQYNRKGSAFHLYLFDRDKQVLELLNAPLVDHVLSMSIIGSSNGLLSVEIYVLGLYPPSLLLWNPAIKQVRHVPRTIDHLKGNFYLGFGFSPIVNDYKIVRVYVPLSYDENGKLFWDGLVHGVEVYSLSTGTWKEIESWHLDNLRPTPESVTANGVIFWRGLKVDVGDEDDSYYWIISFDLAMEVFELIPMRYLDSRAFCELAVYENKLAILSQTWNGNREPFLIDLWVMEEGIGTSEERWSWTKKYTLSSYSGCLDPFCIQRNEIVGNIDKLPGLNRRTDCEEENGEIAVLSMLNLSTEELKNFDISKCGNQYSAIFNYAESLVSVDSTHIEEL